MNWKLIALLSLTGVLTGILTLYMLPARYEAVLSTPVFLLCAYLLARYAEVAYFIHGVLVGFFHTVCHAAIHIGWSAVYFEHHTKEAAQFVRMSEESGATVVQAMMLMGMFSAVVAALVMGLFSIAASKFVKAIRNDKF
jgi:hypothetical protein